MTVRRLKSFDLRFTYTLALRQSLHGETLMARRLDIVACSLRLLARVALPTNPPNPVACAYWDWLPKPVGAQELEIERGTRSQVFILYGGVQDSVKNHHDENIIGFTVLQAHLNSGETPSHLNMSIALTN
jgi:hypothetical protein